MSNLLPIPQFVITEIKSLLFDRQDVVVSKTIGRYNLELAFRQIFDNETVSPLSMSRLFYTGYFVENKYSYSFSKMFKFWFFICAKMNNIEYNIIESGDPTEFMIYFKNDNKQ
jgi:hypothetical protein